jgi:hypothetical protein
MLSVIMLTTVMLNVDMLSVIMLTIVMLNVDMLSVVATCLLDMITDGKQNMES